MLETTCTLVLTFTLAGTDVPRAAEAVMREGMPDVCQVDSRVEALVEDGSNMCGPAAASNALMWLAANGYPELLSRDESEEQSQAALIAELASPALMDTDLASGTSPREVVIGLERFFAQRGYDVIVETMGWRSSARRVGRVPQVNWMLKSTEGVSSLVLNIGWYEYLDDSRTYQRIGGHYVTVAGYEKDGDELRLFVHDPAARDGLKPHTLTCTLKPLREDSQLRLRNGDTQDATGFFELHGIRVKRRADLAIIDGAIAFTPGPKRGAD